MGLRPIFLNTVLYAKIVKHFLQKIGLGLGLRREVFTEIGQPVKTWQDFFYKADKNRKKKTDYFFVICQNN